MQWWNTHEEKYLFGFFSMSFMRSPIVIELPLLGLSRVAASADILLGMSFVPVMGWMEMNAWQLALEWSRIGNTSVTMQHFQEPIQRDGLLWRFIVDLGACFMNNRFCGLLLWVSHISHHHYQQLSHQKKISGRAAVAEMAGNPHTPTLSSQLSSFTESKMNVLEESSQST